MLNSKYKIYPFIKSGSDERQYCAPGADLPVVSLMRSKYDEYDEYHSSMDDLTTITKDGLFGGYTFVKKCIKILESNEILESLILGTPQLGKRNLYPSLHKGKLGKYHRNLVDMLSYIDGEKDILDIANILEVDMEDLEEIVATLKSENIVTKC